MLEVTITTLAFLILFGTIMFLAAVMGSAGGGGGSVNIHDLIRIERPPAPPPAPPQVIVREVVREVVVREIPAPTTPPPAQLPPAPDATDEFKMFVVRRALEKQARIDAMQRAQLPRGE